MNITLSGRCALVTGSDRNTGAVIADALVQAGAKVALHSIDSTDHADSAAVETGAHLCVSGDIATADGCEEVLRQLRAQHLLVDILVNNYGAATPGKWESLADTEWLDLYQKNVLSAVRLIQGLTPGMRERGWGRIVNLGTIGSHRPGRHMPHYYASKGAMATMAVSLCQALTGTGITVNTVSPGLIHTPDLEAGYRARAAQKGWGDDWQDILSHIVEEDFPNPCGRLATRQEVAALVVFLCSEQAGFINGQNIRVDGGAVALV